MSYAEETYDATPAATTPRTLESALATPEFKAKPAQPDIHRAQITSIELRTLDSGAGMIDVNLHSLDGGFDERFSIYVPEEWIDDPFVTPAQVRNELTADEIRAGKKMTPAQIIASSVRNQNGDGKIQQLLAIAKEEGRLESGLASEIVTSDDYVSALSQALAGCQVLFARRPDSGNADPAFRNRLRVQALYPFSNSSDPAWLAKFTKKGRYALAWESGE